MATGPGATALTRTPARRDLHGQRPGEPEQRALGGRVGDGRPAVPQAVAEDGHDPPATALEHARQDQPSEVDRAAEVDVLEPLTGGLVGVEERARPADARVADERIDGAEDGDEAIQRGRERVRIGDVRPGRGQRGRSPPRSAARRSRPAPSTSMAPTASPSAQEPLHGGPPDPARRAGDERDARPPRDIARGGRGMVVDGRPLGRGW